MNYILILIAAILLAFEFAASKCYQRSEGTSLVSGLKFNIINGLFTAVIFFLLSGGKPGFSVFSLLMAFGMSLCAITYSVLGFRILKQGTMGVYSLFLMSGGMLLPYFFGILFLEEELTLLRILGVLLILAAILLSHRTQYDFKASFYLLCLAVFVLNGMVSILSKCHQIDQLHSPVAATAFVMYTGIAKVLISLPILMYYRRDRTTHFSLPGKRALFFAAGSALIGGVSYVLQLIGAGNLPATVLYPLITGGSIIFSTLSGRLFFKEKITVRQISSILLCLAGTILFL